MRPVFRGNPFVYFCSSANWCNGLRYRGALSFFQSSSFSGPFRTALDLPSPVGTTSPALRTVSGVVRPASLPDPPHDDQQDVQRKRQRSMFWQSVILLLGGTAVGTYYLDKRLDPLIRNILTTQWDYEWDSAWRPKYEQESRGRRVVSLMTGPADTPRSTKQIILIRHGQYENPWAKDDDQQGLTKLGREQAELAGQYLSQVLKGKKIRGVFHSDMKRAQETAAIIGTHLKGVDLVEDPVLAEGVPAVPEPPSSTFHPTDIEVELGAARIEAAFRKYFYRSPTPDRPPAYEDEFDVYDVIVCHGNVIRYMFCRALQFPPSAWLRLATYNCGITWISIDNEGHISAREFGNVGYIPPPKVTYT